jgi:hypothetical protein
MKSRKEPLAWLLASVTDWVMERPALKIEIWIDPEPIGGVVVGMRSASNSNRHMVSIPLGSSDEEVWGLLEAGLAKLESKGTKPAERVEQPKPKPVKRSGANGVPIEVKRRGGKQ